MRGSAAVQQRLGRRAAIAPVAAPAITGLEPADRLDRAHAGEPVMIPVTASTFRTVLDWLRPM